MKKHRKLKNMKAKAAKTQKNGKCKQKNSPVEASREEMSTPFTRWSAFEAAVLAKLCDPDSCRETILRRQGEVDDETNEAELVASHFRSELRVRGQDPAACCVFLTTGEATEWVQEATGAKIPITRTTPYLRTLAIVELRYTKKNGVPGWIWKGLKAGRKDKSVPLSTLRFCRGG
jgi:hypothetical protein